MSESSYRINTRIGDEDQVLRVNLKQGVKTINILSLEINPEDEYDVQTSNYGVIVGRVLANKAFGVPNVKVSVFIPIDEADEDDYIISNEYPFKTPQSKDNNGIKYNLIHQRENSPGTFPSKNMLLDNNGTIEVFDKYWKYTTTTNESGDYMIFGVPTGSTQIHYDCDLSDIGILSQKPYDFIARGYDANLFESKTEFTDTDLSSAVHIISQDVTLYVYPFWGDKNANKIGITRKDIDINYEFKPSCVFMGSSITDPNGSYIGVEGQPNGQTGRFDSLATSTGDIEVIRYTPEGLIEELKDNVVGIIDGNGVWCYQIPMNLDRIGTDEYGNITPVNDPSRGIPTRARVRFRISLTDTQNSESSEYTAKYLVPCNPPLKYSEVTDTNDPVVDKEKTGDTTIEQALKNIYEFGADTPDYCFRDLYWGKVYSVKQYYPRFHFEDKPRDVRYNDSHDRNASTDRPKRDGNMYGDPITWTDKMKDLYDFQAFPSRYAFMTSCISSIDYVNGMNPFPYTTMYAGPEEHLDFRTSYWFYFHISEFAEGYSMTSRGLHFCFENDWVNGCLYFPKVIIQRNGKDSYDYFGKRNDDDMKKYYEHNVLSGRHHWYYKKNYGFTTIAPNLHFDYQEESPSSYETYWLSKISIFSRVNLWHGILTRKGTNLGDTVFYYKCGNYERSSYILNWALTYKRLYSTDIILLGNLEDIYDSLPRLYNSLPSTTCVFPPVSTPKTISEAGMSKHCYAEQIKTVVDSRDNELVDIYYNTSNILGNYNGYTQNGEPQANALYNDAKDCVEKKYPDYDWEILMRSLLRRSSLFFGLRVGKVDDFLEYDVPTFINTSRICELDVHNDSAFNLPGTDKIVPTNGIIDKFDISTNDNRSAFASMNYDINKFIYNPVTGYKQYVTTPLYVTSFDGRLADYIDANPFQYDTDAKDDSYVVFRFGRPGTNWKGPFVQTQRKSGGDNAGWNLIYEENNGPLVLPDNSFYFFFGLRTGFSAIDALRDKFIGRMKEDTSIEPGVSCVVSSSFTCENGQELGSVEVRMAGLKEPIEWALYHKNISYRKGKTRDSSTFTIDKLNTGPYRIHVIDGLNRELDTYFSIFAHAIGISVNASKDDKTNDGYLLFSKVDSHDITKINEVEGSNNTKIEIYAGDSKYIMSFSTAYKSINSSGLTVTFLDSVEGVDATLTMDGYDCINTQYTYVFTPAEKPELTLNGIPVEYIKEWREYDNAPSYQSSEPDSVFSGQHYYVWDSINTLHPSRNEGRPKYQFPEGMGLTERLAYLSSMSSSVFGGINMSLKNKTMNSNYVPVTIYPNYSREYLHYYWPADNYWDKDAAETNVMRTSNVGNADVQVDVPHIVGSNYPISADTRTFLKVGINSGTYTNNLSIKKTSVGVGQGVYGVNLFGLKHRQYNELDKPGSLSPDTILDDSHNGQYNIRDATNYFGVRTVDKRIDYQFIVKTPLILPSGYNRFTNLTDKKLMSGNLSLDLYGGIRLNYDEFGKINCYNIKKGLLTDGPNEDAKLYDYYAYEDNDNSTQLTLEETKWSIWGDDIDHVTLKHYNLRGIEKLSMTFVSCSPSFENGYVAPGSSENIYLSYKSGVNVIRQNREDYDIEYNVSGATSSAFTEYFGSFSGTNMTFKVAPDEYWNGSTFSDIDTSKSHNDIYPEWARLSNSDMPYGSKNEELAIYLCKPTSTTKYEILSTYKVHFETIANDLPEDPVYSGDSTHYISAFYRDGDIEIPLTDEECNEYVKFEIDYSDDAKMQAKFPSNAFLVIPTRRVCTMEGCGTSLKQGICYNHGYAYYAGSINVSVDKENRYAIIRLNTPLRNYNGTIDYASATSLSAPYWEPLPNWHTIGEVDNYYCDGADVRYIRDRAEFEVRVIDTRQIAVVYFSIQNGLKYRIVIDFTKND